MKETEVGNGENSEASDAGESPEPKFSKAVGTDVTENKWGLPNFKGQSDESGLQENGQFLLELEHPVQFGKNAEPIELLKFRPPKGKHYRAFPMEPKEMGTLLDFGAKLCAVSSAHFDLLEGADVFRVITVSSGFFSGAPEQIGKQA